MKKSSLTRRRGVRVSAEVNPGNADVLVGNPGNADVDVLVGNAFTHADEDVGDLRTSAPH